MFGSVGAPEFLLILVLALLLFGPRKLPQIGRTLGRALAEFRGATQEFKSSLEREVEVERFERGEEPKPSEPTRPDALDGERDGGARPDAGGSPAEDRERGRAEH
jgi:TatA/E family protein of Tat protein translocase